MICLPASQVLIAQAPYSTARRDVSTPSPPTLHPVTFWLVGDGPLSESSSTIELAGLFDPARVTVVSKPTGDHNLRTYITGGPWAQTLTRIRSGDVVLFHLAEPGAATSALAPPPTDSLAGSGDEIRKAAVTGELQSVHTYGWYLRQYVVNSIARGATPILCNCAAESGPGSNAHGSRDIALQQRVVFVDLGATPTSDHAAGVAPGRPRT